jgi:hypothetical protein
MAIVILSVLHVMEEEKRMKKIKNKELFNPDTKIILIEKYFCLIDDIKIYKDPDNDYLIKMKDSKKVKHVSDSTIINNHIEGFYFDVSFKYNEPISFVKKEFKFVELSYIPTWWNNEDYMKEREKAYNKLIKEMMH